MCFLGEIVTAMVTPFDTEGNVDYMQVEKLARFLVDNGTETILIAGTTGESPTLKPEEIREMIVVVKSAVGSRAKILLGAGTNNTEKSVELAKNAESYGVDAILTVVPYYNKPSQEGIKAHFGAVAQATSLPIVMYNIPGRTGVNMAPETIAELAHSYENIIAVKQSNPDMDQVTQIVNLTPADFYVYSGDDSLTLPMLSLGGYGVVSVSSHLIGNKMKEMVTSYKNGDVKKAAEIHGECFKVFKTLFIAPNPTPLKFALMQLSVLSTETVRLPLVQINEQQRENVKAMLSAAESLIPVIA